MEEKSIFIEKGHLDDFQFDEIPAFEKDVKPLMLELQQKCGEHKISMVCLLMPANNHKINCLLTPSPAQAHGCPVNSNVP